MEEQTKILLSNGDATVVDAQDQDLGQFAWSKNQRGRVIRQVEGTLVKLHKVIAERMGISGEVDHANGDTLDNRRSNLRAATRSENNSNRQKFSNGTPASKYKGVQFTHGKWAASIQKDKERKWLGYFKHEDSAAKAYDIAAKELHGEFAVLNFPDNNAALAAEREKYQLWIEQLEEQKGKEFDRANDLRDQLAAAREVLRKLRVTPASGRDAVIDAALAKIGGKQ